MTWPEGTTPVVLLWWLWLQDAGAHPVSSWAVQAVLPALCGTWRVCRSTALGLQEGGLAAVMTTPYGCYHIEAT